MALTITTNSMLNRWDYTGIGMACYSDENCESYKKAVAFLGADQPVEDWAGGTGWAKQYFTGSYKNIDGSPHKNVDVVADLVYYTSSVDNILLRQALEFNVQWDKILANVCKSFTKKLCLITCVPFVSKTTKGVQYSIYDDQGIKISGQFVQEMNLKKADILAFFQPDTYRISEETIVTKQDYNQDWILYVERI